MKKLPALQFYVGDWRKDPGVQALDYEARGVWLEVLFLMHESDDRGRLLLNGLPMPIPALAQVLGIEEAKLKQIVSKIEAYGVSSRGDDGALENRRMMRDEAIRRERAKAGSKGGKSEKRSKTEAKAKQNGSKHEAKERVFSEYETETEDEEVVEGERESEGEGFQALWSELGRGALITAEIAYHRAVPDLVSHDDLVAARRAYMARVDDPKFAKDLGNWISLRGYADPSLTEEHDPFASMGLGRDKPSAA